MRGNKRGFHVLDAPVTGGDTGAKAGTLYPCGWRLKEDFEACMPLFEAMGTNINYQERQDADSTIAGESDHDPGTRSGVCEALAYAQAKGLDLDSASFCVQVRQEAVSWICSDRRFWKEITARASL